MPSIFDILNQRQQFGQYGSPYPNRQTNASASPLLGGYWGGTNNTQGVPGQAGDPGAPSFYLPPWARRQDPFAPSVDLGIDEDLTASPMSTTSAQMARGNIDNDDWDPADRNSAQNYGPDISFDQAKEGVTSFAKEHGPGLAKDLAGLAIGGPVAFGLGKMAGQAFSTGMFDNITGPALGFDSFGDYGSEGYGNIGADPSFNVDEEEGFGGYDDNYGGPGEETGEGQDTSDDDSTGGVGEDDEEDGEEEDGETNYKGGLITADKLRGPDLPGPDDGFGSLDAGEYVVRKSAVKHYGSPLLAALNSRKIPKRAVSMLLKKYG